MYLKTKIISPILFPALLCISLACNKSKYDQIILGNWIIIKVQHNIDQGEPPPIYPFFSDPNLSGFTFLDNENCEFNQGFYEPSTCYMYSHLPKYYGKKTVYKLRGNELKVHRKANGTWQTYYIESIQNDTLVINDEFERKLTFTKRYYDKIPKLHFDKIVLEYDDCDKYCELIFKPTEREIAIGSAGQKKQFKKLDPNLSTDIIQDLNNINIASLDSVYLSNKTDQSNTKMTFYTAKGIISVNLEGDSGPLELLWLRILLYNAAMNFVSHQ
jgi:hypothetical protein